MEKKDPGRPTRLTSSKEAISSKSNKHFNTSPDSPHNPQTKGKPAHSRATSQGDVSKKRSEAQSRPMDKQKTADPSPTQKRNYPKKESRDSGRKHNNVNSPNSNPNLKSRQLGVDSLQVTVNGDKQGRSVQRPSPKKMERNYAKKMERGMMMRNSNMDSGEEARGKRSDPKNVQILHRDSRPVQGQEQGSTPPPQPGKGSSKKRTIDRKPLGKLVNAKLREGEDAKAPNGPTTPKKSDIKQQEKETERQPGWKVQESPSPAVEQEVQGGSDLAEPWKESMERQEEELETTYIFRLTKRSLKFPRALYYCRLCNYHIDTLPQCWLHIDQSRHNRLAKAKESENFFKNLPMPSPSHARALTKLLEEVTDEHVLTGREMNQRNDVRQRVENALQSHLPECKVKMYGSSLSGFGFHDSDVNLDVDFPSEKQASKILVAVSQGIAAKVDKDFTEFEADFEGKHPCVRFKDIDSGYMCELGTGNQNAIQSSQLMVEYNECDGRLRPLVMGLRYWARMCGIDQQAIGAMPAHTFVLLVIYFLQQCEPQVLPILQQNEHFKTKNKKTIGDLWVDLLRFYLVGINIEEIVISIRQREPVLRADLKLPNRRIAIEDPFANGKKNVAKSLTTASVFQYIMDRFHDALKYFGIPQNGLSPDSKGREQTSPDGSRANGPKEAGDVAEGQDGSGNEGRGEEDRIAAGDTLDGSEHRGSNDDDCNTAADIGAKLAEMVLSEVELEEAGVIGTSKDGPQGSRGEAPLSSEAISRIDGERTPNAIQKSDSPADGCDPNSSPSDALMPLDQDAKGAARLDNSVTSAFINEPDTTSMNKNKELTGDGDGTGDDSRNRQDEGETVDDDVDYVFTFDKGILTRGEVVQLICTSCLKEGHVSKDCPEDALPPLKPLPPMDPQFLEYGTIVCEELMLRNQPSHQDVRGREKCIVELEFYIRQHALWDARLSLFGSSGNGFGFRNSDLDICLTFQDRNTGQDVDVGFVIEKLAAALKRNHNLYNIVPIPTAKVPIVKFVHRPTRLEGDISLYNTLAQCNTRLLYMYSQIDERVRVLGYSMKFLAKYCDIGDASRGSLSSYAYTLLTIYFLQQRKPPILPVLQELYTGDKQPVNEVDGWNAWFFDNLNQLSRVWKGRYKNTESIGSLWLGMLRFYTEEFDFTKYVVSIRQHKPLTRFEKLWMTPQRGVALEDPFDLEHNLGGAASKKMAVYIIQVLRNARDLFGTPRRVPREHIMNYFLDLEFLSGGEPPPNDRGCRICGKIGHFVKDCPIKRRGLERKEQEKKDRERRDRPSPNDSGTPGRNMARDVKPTDSPNAREERNRSSDSKHRPGNAVNKVESPAAKNSVIKDKPASGPKEEKERSKPPGKTTERSVDDVARQLYPVKPIPIKKTDEKVKPAKDSKQTAPSITANKEKPAGTEKKAKGSMEPNPSTPPSNASVPNPDNSRSKTRKEKEMGRRRGAGEASRVASTGEVDPCSRVGEDRDQTPGNEGHVGDRNGQEREACSFTTQQQQQPTHPSQQDHDVRSISGHPLISELGGFQAESSDMVNNPRGPAPDPLPPSQIHGSVGPPAMPPPMGPMGFQDLPLQALMGFNMTPEEILKSMIQQQQQVQHHQLQHQQQQQQDKLAALFQVMGKQSPLQGGAPTQSPLIRPPTTPASAQTLDEIEHQLKSKQQQQQQTSPRLPPGAKSMEQLEQQFRQDQFFHNKNMSPGIRPQQPPQASPQQQALRQHPQQQQQQQQSPRQQLSPQQLFPPQQCHLPPSQKVIGRPPGLGYANKDQEQEKEPQLQQRSASQSQPIPIDPRQAQQHQQWHPLKHPGWGSPSSAFSPPSPYNRMVASPPSHQRPGFHPQMQQHPAASPPHNLLQSPPGASTPPAMAQYFGHNPFGPSVLPANFLESRQGPGGMAVSPPHHPHNQHHQQQQQPQGWPQQPQHPTSAVGWHNQHEPQQRQQQQHQQHAEPQMASAGSPRSPEESAGAMSSGVMPLEAQFQVQQAFGQAPSNRQDLAQSFHYSPLSLNPSLPRSSHATHQQPSQHRPNHPAQQHPQHALPFQPHSDPGWQMQQQQHQQQQQQHSNMQFTTTAAVGGPIMSAGQGEQSGELAMSSSSRFPPHQTMR